DINQMHTDGRRRGNAIEPPRHQDAKNINATAEPRIAQRILILDFVSALICVHLIYICGKNEFEF
ncbi:MAG TPA: hypothetical protein VGG44_09660, partial [Tepidisphaeraceae bacterium]